MAASAGGLATKHRLGKLPQAEVLRLGYAEHLARLGATGLPISLRHALEAGGLNWSHRDPFDRMLAVQAMVESATLVTADVVVADVVRVRLLW
ncbi:type II toxin-antitoxin system VapC family toxin [Rhodococcus sp. NPDC058514]|uniref:type II toxin-antitoxin system VapC family toxin n=1 Tax=unclassified Rhodococcus (in: high G+C Gram-positive bacteria) TaxID=192944 RepID=UPI0036520517